jgi:hypothetical protein
MTIAVVIVIHVTVATIVIIIVRQRGADDSAQHEAQQGILMFSASRSGQRQQRHDTTNPEARAQDAMHDVLPVACDTDKSCRRPPLCCCQSERFLNSGAPAC